jgi:transposase
MKATRSPALDVFTVPVGLLLAKSGLRMARFFSHLLSGSERIMCLKPQVLPPIPQATYHLAQRLFPPHHVLRLIGDEYADLLHDSDFADLYSHTGQPALSPALLALVTVLQAREQCSDRVAVEMVRFGIDWKYALHLPLEDTAFDASVLCEFRQRIVGHEATRRIFDAFLQRLQTKGWLNGRQTQRTDSLAVFGAIRQLNRLELVMETLRLALEAIARVDALWLARHTPEEWRDTYGQWTQAERLVRGTGARGLAETQQRLLQTGRDGFILLQAVAESQTAAATAALPAVALLRQVWEQQYRRVEETTPEATMIIELCDHASRSAEERRELIDNPHDPQARFATKRSQNKRSQNWTGYKLHLTETAEEEAPPLITDVVVVAANSYDAVAVDTIQQRLEERELLPQTHLADAGYVDGATLVESARHGVELLGPVAADNSSALHKAAGFGVEHFELDFSLPQARCPQGQQAVRWHQQPRADNPRQEMVVISWDKAVCRNCAQHGECLGPGQRPRTIKVSAQYPQLVARRQEQKSDAFQERYRRRAGIEATFSHLVNVHRARRTPYRGGGKTELHYLALASAINLQRVVAWQAGLRPQRQRRSCLRSLLADQRESAEEKVG